MCARLCPAGALPSKKPGKGPPLMETWEGLCELPFKCLSRELSDGEEELQRQSSVPKYKSHGALIDSCTLWLKTHNGGQLLLQRKHQP